ncbi:MAG: diguanylate cyclase [Synergistaceae bacterium]|nr:diguanylate cyclase [Synergistaceae bacterium]
MKNDALRNRNYLNLWLVPVIIVFIAGAAMTLFSFRLSSDLKRRSYDRQTEETLQQAAVFDISITEQYKTLNAFAEGYGLGLFDRRLSAARLSIVRNAMGAGLAGIADAEGSALMDDGRRLYIGEGAFFARTMLSKNMLVRDEAFTDDEGRPLFVISAPLTVDGSVRGVLFVCFNGEQFRNLTKLAAFDGDSYSFIVAPAGDFILGSGSRHLILGDSDGDAEDDKNIFNLLKENDSSSGHEVQTLAADMNQERGGVAGFTSGGVRRYIVYEPLAVNDWYLIDVISASSVEQHTGSIIKEVFLLLAIMVACSASLMLFIYWLNKFKNRELVEEQERLRQAEEIYRSAFEFSDSVLVVIDIQNDSVIFNSNFQKIFGFEPAAGTLSEIKSEVNSFINENDLNMVMERFLDSEKDAIIECRIGGRVKKETWAEFRFTKIFDRYGKVQRIIGRLTNIDEKKRHIQRLKSQAESDPLTGLLNRKAAFGYMKDFLSGRGKDGLHAFMVIDVDDYKKVNDIFGHVTGDAVLTVLAKEMRSFFRSSDIVGRLGGDEFMVLMRDIPSGEFALSRANAFCRTVERLGRSCNLKCALSVSIGVAVSSEGDIDKLYEEADKALYHVKSQGKCGCAIYKKGEMSERGNGLSSDRRPEKNDKQTRGK